MARYRTGAVDHIAQAAPADMPMQISRIMQDFPAIDMIGLFLCISYRHKSGMIYGYARVSTDGQSVAAQVTALNAAGAGKVFREVASGAKTDRAQLRKAIAALR